MFGCTGSRKPRFQGVDESDGCCEVGRVSRQRSAPGRAHDLHIVASDFSGHIDSGRTHHTEGIKGIEATTYTLDSQDRNGRWVAGCQRADGANVNAWRVRNGHAIDWQKYSAGRYSRLQMQAQWEKRGIWQGDFEQPCAVRDRRYHHKSTCD